MRRYNLVFQGSAFNVDAPTIALSPADRGWNDFGFNYHATARVYDGSSNDPLLLRIFVLPFEGDGLVRSFAKWFDSGRSEQSQAPSFAGKEFVALLSSEESYKKLYYWCGGDDEEYLSVLRSLEDLTFLADEGGVELAVARRVIASEEFRLGVLRTGTAYRAFRRGYRALMTSDGRVSDSRKGFTFTRQLDGFNGVHRLKINFLDNPLFVDRVHCIVGANGIGKSRLLASLVSSIAESELDSDGPLDFDGDAPRFGRVLSYVSERESPMPVSFPGRPDFDYRFFETTRPIAVEREGAIENSNNVTMGRMLVDVLRESELDETGFNRYRFLMGSLRAFVDIETICIPIREGLSNGLAFSSEDGSRWARFSPLHTVNEQTRLEITGALDTEREISFFSVNDKRITVSSGQRSFLRFALHVVSTIGVGSLVVMDEPETHLHPNLVSALSSFLYRLLEKTKSIAIIATHSVYLVREVPTHCNHVVRVDEDGVVIVGKVYMRTLGASPTSLSLALFGDDTSKAFHDKIVREIAKSEGGIDDILDRYGEFLSPDLMSQVRREISKVEHNEGV